MVMLHFWLKVSTNTAWIRLLPSLIGLIGLIYLVKLGGVAGFKPIPILLATTLTASSWVFVHYSEEVGSYSLAISTAFALIYYLINYLHQPGRSNYLKLLLVSLFNLFVYFGSWFYLPVVGGCLLFKSISQKKYSHLISFVIIGSLVVSFLYFDQLRYKWGFAASDYLTINKLNSVPAADLPAKFIKDNLDYFTYVLGATPWYLDATFFPSSNRFGSSFTYQYYLSLVVAGIVVLAYYAYLSLITSENFKEFIHKFLPIYFLISILITVNLVSLMGLYPIGAVRMSLFYAPVVIWLLLQYLDLLFRRFNLFSIIIVAFCFMVIINGLTRLYRIPQKHIGNHYFKPLYYST